MKYGVFQFSTDYAIRIDDLARETEGRGFESRRSPHAVLAQNECAVHFIAKEVLRISLE